MKGPPNLSLARLCLAELVAAGVAVCISLSGCNHETRLRYRDDLVEITERSTIQFLNVHASSDTEVLTIWGRDFKDVRGRNPCYLRIPGRSMILFVTGRDFDGGQAIVHLANTSTKQIVNFPAYDSHIGSEIGEPKPNCYERVAKIDGDRLVIEATSTSRHFEYFIDLSEPRFEREEADFENSLTGTVNHYVYERGKAHK